MRTDRASERRGSSVTLGKNMRRYFALILVLLCRSPLVAAAEEPSLRLEVYSFVVRDDVTAAREHYVLRLRMFLRNIGKSMVTTPTSTPSGGWTGLLEDGESRSLIYSVGYGDVRGTKVVPSAFRHFPVELRPGEMTELPSKEFRMAEQSSVSKVSVVFSVDEDFAQRFGWWSGRLRAVHVVGEGDNPFVEPMKPEKGVLQR